MKRMPATLREAPLLIDADVHRTHLTTRERLDRMHWAMHEAAHYLVAVRLKVPPMSAWVRVPGREHNHSIFETDGRIGWVIADGDSLMRGAAIAAAGPITEMCLMQTDKRVYAEDMQDIQEWIKLERIRWATAYDLWDAIVGTVWREWAAIDAVAACLLHCGDARGELSWKRTDQLSDLIENQYRVLNRRMHFPRPPLEQRAANAPRIRYIREWPMVEVRVPEGYGRLHQEQVKRAA